MSRGPKTLRKIIIFILHQAPVVYVPQSLPLIKFNTSRTEPS